MLGLRGIRLAVMFGEVYEMQAKAIVEAMLEVGGPQERRDRRDHAAAGRLRDRARARSRD